MGFLEILLIVLAVLWFGIKCFFYTFTLVFVTFFYKESVHELEALKVRAVGRRAKEYTDYKIETAITSLRRIFLNFVSCLAVIVVIKLVFQYLN